MILIDYNAIALANMFATKIEIDENILRHMIFNTIRMYRRKFKAKYGEIVIAADAGNNWRKEYFPEYKACRKTSRDSSTLDWSKIFDILRKILGEIEENFQYPVIKIDGLEADDIIGQLVFYTQEFGKNEDVMIVSADNDFLQLQKFQNVKQFSTSKKKLITEKDPQKYLFEHICRGDTGDGVPNVLSADNVLVDKIRQSSLTTKKLKYWYENRQDLEGIMPTDVYRNYHRNKMMIDLSSTPQKYSETIINIFENKKKCVTNKIMNYFIKNRCRVMLENINDFIF